MIPESNDDDTETLPELPKVLDAQYFSSSNNIILVLSTGDIVSLSDGSGGSSGFGNNANAFFDEPPDFIDDPSAYYSSLTEPPTNGSISYLDSPNSSSIDIVGSIDVGISAAKWSPDEEILALVTKADKFVLLSRIFEPIAETPILPSDHSLSKHVSVGWGKRETQFQGRGARAQRDPTMPEKVDLGVLSAQDTLTHVEISWRGDGEVVSIISVDTDPIERRTVRVYTRSGTLDSVSEPVDGLIGLVSWRPSGNLIAAVQRRDELNESSQVVFFERNGLRRGEFSLRISPVEHVTGLSWNSDSDCLAVSLSDRVQLWTTKNYHWYLKQEITTGLTPTKLTWHPEKSHTLLVTFDNGSIHICEFQWDITRGTTAPPSDIGLVAVVDGQNINLTPLAIANTPPPMSFRTLKTSRTPTHVAISSTNTRFAILSGFELIIADWNVNDPSNKGVRDIVSPHIKAVIPLDEAIQGIDAPKQVAMIGTDVVVFAVDNEDETSDIVTIQLFQNDEGSITHEILAANTIPEQVFLLKSLPDGQGAIFQTINGSVLGLRSVTTDVINIGTLPRRCEAIEVYFPESSEDEFDQPIPVVFGLHSSGKVYANEKQIASGATSICMTDRYLVFTTAQHYLKFVHLTQPEQISVPADSSVDDERCRAIERGSLIVTAMPSKSAFTLQAPRGNLETFYPRIMTLTLVRQDIKQKRYDLAFNTCRVHRIDLNLLYDYQPHQFIDNVELFVRQMQSTNYIDLFLSGLQEANVAQTKYKETVEEIKLPESLIDSMKNLQIYQPITLTKSSVEEKSKVNTICDAILSVLSQDSYKVEYRQSILTAYACKVPPALEDALEMVGKGRESNPVLTNDSIQHLCFLQDVNLLYDTALGIYDLPLTLLIAQQSTKDPKEYLPFLRNLQSLDTLRRQFEIDTYLKRYPKALKHLAAIGDSVFDELQEYVVEHDLYKEALEIFKYEVPKQDQILLLQAAFMLLKNQHQQAGLVYEMLRDYESALNAYLTGGCWQQALSVVESNPGNIFEEEKLLRVANELADKTSEAHNYQAAATIYLEYLNNPMEAARILCTGFLYDEAIRIVSRQGEASGPLFKSTIDPGLLEGFAQISELLADCNSQIKSQVNRINELRTKKAEDPNAFFADVDGSGHNDLDIPDNVSIAASETSTAPSFFTKYTGKTGSTAKTGASRRTAKNRRREERKRARGKQGSIYEEEYLVNSMGRLIDRLHEMQPNAVRLIDGLLRRSMRTHAYTIQTAYSEIMELLVGCADRVFVLSERDRERYDDEGNVYYIPQIVVPTVTPFPKSDILNY